METTKARVPHRPMARSAVHVNREDLPCFFTCKPCAPHGAQESAAEFPRIIRLKSFRSTVFFRMQLLRNSYMPEIKKASELHRRCSRHRDGVKAKHPCLCRTFLECQEFRASTRVQQLYQRRLEFIRMEPERTWLALVSDATPRVDQIQPIRPACVGRFG